MTSSFIEVAPTRHRWGDSSARPLSVPRCWVLLRPRPRLLFIAAEAAGAAVGNDNHGYSDSSAHRYAFRKPSLLRLHIQKPLNRASVSALGAIVTTTCAARTRSRTRCCGACQSGTMECRHGDGAREHLARHGYYDRDTPMAANGAGCRRKNSCLSQCQAKLEILLSSRVAISLPSYPEASAVLQALSQKKAAAESIEARKICASARRTGDDGWPREGNYVGERVRLPVPCFA